MTTKESLNSIHKAIAETRIELSNLDHMVRAVRDGNVTIANLTAEVARIRTNADSSLESKSRASKLSNLSWQLDLAKGDQRNLENAIDEQKKYIVTTGAGALTLMMKVYGILFIKRKADAEKQVRDLFDMTRVPCAPETLAACRRDVIQVKEMEAHLWRVQFDQVAMMLELRRLEEREETLIKVVASEPGLILNMQTEKVALPVAVEPIAATQLAIA